MDNNIKTFNSIYADEGTNFKVTTERFIEESKFNSRVIALYQTVPNILKDYPRDLIPILQMYWLCFRSLLVSMELLFEAHIPEAFAIASRSAEAVAVARKMSLYPGKILGWVKREKETGQPFRRVLGTLFPKEDKLLQPEIFEFYQTTSEHGRHTGFESTIFFTDFSDLASNNKVYFTYCDIEDETNLKRSINYFINMYIKFLFVFKEIFGKYLNKEWILELENVNGDYLGYKETLKKEFGYINPEK